MWNKVIDDWKNPVEYIDREATKRALQNIDAGRKGGSTLLTPDEFAEYLDEFPAADVVSVVHGRWERDADGDWYCTNCDEVVAICESGRERTYRKPYCPNCGAKMDGGVVDG